MWTSHATIRHSHTISFISNPIFNMHYVISLWCRKLNRRWRCFIITMWATYTDGCSVRNIQKRVHKNYKNKHKPSPNDRVNSYNNRYTICIIYCPVCTVVISSFSVSIVWFVNSYRSGFFGWQSRNCMVSQLQWGPGTALLTWIL